MVPSERDFYLRTYYSAEYRAELARLRDWTIEPPDDEDGL
jgi:hypothetical protein